jgi:hypothetical protein
LAAGCARDSEIDAIERQRARAALQAVAARRDGRAALDLGTGIAEAAEVPAWLVDRVARWLAGEPARRAELERLAAHPNPGYEHVFRAFQLTYGACDWHRHARSARREQLHRAIARYDREAARLAELGQPPAEPTAMAWLIGQLQACGSSPASPGYLAPLLDRESKQLRRRRRELDPAEPGRRDRRRERRVARMRDAMRTGIRFRRSTLPPAAIRAWLADAMMAGSWAALCQTWSEALDAAAADAAAAAAAGKAP